MAEHGEQAPVGVGETRDEHVQPLSVPMHDEVKTMAPETESTQLTPGPEDIPDLTDLFFAERMKGFIAPARVGKLEPFLDRVEVIGGNPENQVSQDRE